MQNPQNSDLIGKGKFSQVYRKKDASGNYSAVKQFPVESFEEMKKESNIHRFIPENEHILKFINQDFERRTISTEYCEMGSLETEYSSDGAEFTVTETIQFARDVILGVQHLHDSEIIHGDLAARNVLLKNGRVKICDFGRSKSTRSHINSRNIRKFSRKCLSKCIPFEKSDNPRDIYPIRWFNYQLLSGKQSCVSKKSDIWAFGVLIWELFTCCLELPYDSVLTTCDTGSIKMYLKHGYRLNKPECMPELFYLMVVKCWAKNLDHQIRVEELDVRLQQFGKSKDYENILVSKTNFADTMIQTKIQGAIEGNEYTINRQGECDNELLLVRT